MRFSPAFLDELRNRVSIVDLVGRKVRLQRRGRDHWGLCPFHNEKTPSFSVSDDKGFYHCFGCGAHGDAITFLTETEGASFTDAVERLAGLAGMAVPAPDPQAAARQKKQRGLVDVMQQAADWYAEQLAGKAGADARAYLDKRGLKPQTIKQFQIGYAPDSRTALRDFLLARDVSAEELAATGMIIVPEGDDGRGGEPYDRFRGRIMFPIRDRRGRIIAFGGRAMDPNARAKYLNSPETPIFHKGQQLYNLDQAAAPARSADRLLVVEGYMDVIALAEAGLDYCVAPLGTALGEDQLRMLWRLVPEPILAFDGDEAGQRAALRAVERALPLLQPAHSLRVLLLPKGDDPDTLVRREGRDVFEARLDKAAPLIDMLWQAEQAVTPLTTPEQRAGFAKRIRARVADIKDETVRGFYRSEVDTRLDAFFAHGRGQRSPAGRRQGRGGRPQAQLGASNQLKQLESQLDLSGERREKVLLVAFVNHPWLLESHLEALAELTLRSTALDKLRQLLIAMATEKLAEGADSQGSTGETGTFPLDREAIQTHFEAQGMGSLLTRITGETTSRSEWFLDPQAAPEDVQVALSHILALMARDAVKAELDDEVRKSDGSDESFARIRALKERLDTMPGGEVSIAGYGAASGRDMGS